MAIKTTEWINSMLVGVDDEMRVGVMEAIYRRTPQYSFFTHFFPTGAASTTSLPGFTVTVITVGTVVDTGAAGGWLGCTGGANDGEGVQAQGDGLWVLPAANHWIFCEASLALTDADDVDWMFGLAATDTNVFSTDPTELIVFRGDDGDANVDFQVRDGGTGDAADTTVDMANTTAKRLGFVVKGITSVTPYIDGTAYTAVTANIPTSVSRLTFGMLNGATTANNVAAFDYINLLYV